MGSENAQIFGVKREDINLNKPKSALFHSMRSDSLQTNELSDQKKMNRNRIHYVTADNFREGRWDPHEHTLFVKSCLVYGNNWRKVQKEVVTRSSAQIRSHAQKFVIKLCRKYGIAPSRRAYTAQSNNSVKIIKPKIIPRNLDQIEEEERKLLEIFNVITKDNIINQFSFEEIMHSSQRERSNSVTFPSVDDLNKADEQVDSHYESRKYKKSNIKRPIFRIEKTNSASNFIEKVNEELRDIASYNNKIMLALFDNQSLENNLNSLNSWLFDNQCYKINDHFPNLESQMFLDNMDIIVNKFKHFINCDHHVNQ